MVQNTTSQFVICYITHILKRHLTWYVCSCEYSSSLTQALGTAVIQKTVSYTFEKGEGECTQDKKKKEQSICRDYF